MKGTEAELHPVKWGSNTIVIDRLGQSTKIGYVVDTNTGEILDVYDEDKKVSPKGYVRNSRRINSQRKQHTELEAWRITRNINEIDDVRCKKDLDAINGDHSFYSSRMSIQGIELLHSFRTRLSKKAKDLGSMLILDHLHAMNYCIVSNEEIRKLIGDKSGNYTKYLNELEEINFCEVRNIPKTHKLITINPAYGYKGGVDPESGVSLGAVAKYYRRQRKEVDFRQIYENGLLKAA